MNDSWAEIQQLLARYTWSHDSRDFEALAQCFTEDAQYTMRIGETKPSDPTIGGNSIAELVRSFKAKQTDQRRHLITNVIADEMGEDRAVVRSYVTVLATQPDSSALITTGTCVDEVVRSESGWRFVRKEMHLDKGF